MQMQSFDELADRLVFIHLDITCWSGRKSLTPEDLGLDRAHWPPESLISLGDKQLIDPAALRTFTSLRGAAHRHCLAVGARFLGGYAVPAAQAQRLLDRLADVQRQAGQEEASVFGNPGIRAVKELLPSGAPESKWREVEMQWDGKAFRPWDFADFLADPASPLARAADGKPVGLDPAAFR